MRSIRLIISHEFLLLRRNPKVLLSGAFGLGLILLFLLTAIREGEASPRLTGLFLFMILAAAAGTPMTLAIHSFVGEKERRTLEPLLTLPVSLPRLVAGKAAVTVLVSLFEIALVFATGILGAWLVGQPEQLAFIFNGITVYVAVVMAPIFVTLFSLVAVVISGRSTNTQTALNMGLLVVAPILAVPFAMWLGWITLGRTVLLFATVALAILCVVVFRIALTLLRPEALLSRPGR